MLKHKKLLFTLIVIGTLLLFSSLLFSDSNSENGTLIDRETLQNYNPNMKKGLDVVVRENQDLKSNKVRSVFIADGKNSEKKIGALSKKFLNSPIETLFVEVNDERFIVVWIDNTVSGNLETVTFQRPQKLSTDDSMKQLRVSKIYNRVAIIPIFNNEIELWDSVEAVLIDSSEGLGFESEVNFNPAVRISDLFIPISI